MRRRRTRRITDISTEVKEVLLVTGPRDQPQSWCQQCGMRVSMLTPDEVATVFGTNAHAILRRVDDGTLHSTVAGHGLRVCIRSLAALQPEASRSCRICAAASHDEDR